MSGLECLVKHLWPCDDIAAGTGPMAEREKLLRNSSVRLYRYAGLAYSDQGLHFEFCILHFVYGLAGSISTAMFRHLPWRNRITLNTARVKWPTTIASQMSVGRSPMVV